MSIRIVELVNAIQPKSYLELGTWDGANFRAVNCGDKVSVDINGNGTFTGTTDEFFAQNTRRFDAVFIDACHDIDFVLRDWSNSIKVVDLVIFHDMIPPTRRHTKHTECSNSFLLLNHFLDTGLDFRSLDHDCGLTVVRKEHFAPVESVGGIEYSEFMRKVKSSGKVVGLEELIRYAS